MTKKLFIGIPCNRFDFQGFSAHMVKHQYIQPLLEIAGATPLLIPAIGGDFDLKDIAGKLDGLLLTGAPSHVSPERYGAARKFRKHELDEDRDATNLPVIQSAIEMDMPLFAICRGLQEMNVACGGTLQQHVHKLPGKRDHRGDQDLTLAERFEDHRHKIHTQKGGMFERFGLPDEFAVNSLHHQGIDTLAPGLFVEGISEDGLIEAVSVPRRRFILGMQWHPEADLRLSPVSVKLFENFGRALRGQPS